MAPVEKLCPAGAINFKDTEKKIRLQVGSVILAPGFTAFDPARFDYYSYRSSPDVVTSLEFERILSATGPYSGHLLRPSEHARQKSGGTPPQKIAWLQCVGSRDLNRCDNGYCSSVCCMYAVKQAVMAKDHSGTGLDCAIFYMDMRTQGKDFDRYYENAQKRRRALYPCQDPHRRAGTGKQRPLLRYVDDNGRAAGKPSTWWCFQPALKSAGMPSNSRKTLGIELDQYHFTRSDSFHPVATSVPGIYACGVFTGPKDIPQSVMEASAAACAATENLAAARNTQTKAVTIPTQRDVSREAPRIGVFVCNCGINIGGIVRVPEVAEYAGTLPGVVYVEENLFTCSQDTQDKMTEVIREKALNRVVVAACTPQNP